MVSLKPSAFTFDVKKVDESENIFEAFTDVLTLLVNILKSILKFNVDVLVVYIHMFPTNVIKYIPSEYNVPEFIGGLYALDIFFTKLTELVVDMAILLLKYPIWDRSGSIVYVLLVFIY